MIHTAYHHSSNVIESALEAMHDMNVRKEDLLTIHWRFGEDSCKVEKDELHRGFDFCWGTTEYFWAKLSDVVEVLHNHIKSCGNKIKHVYLATDYKGSLYWSFRQQLEKYGINMTRASDVPTLESVQDNYYLSLIEQELVLQSSIFVGSAGSTWTEEMIAYKKMNYGQDLGTCATQTITQLLRDGNRVVKRHSYWKHVDPPDGILATEDDD
eukprot:TRINITY_DN2819_c0_g1_i1.p2 TRINITY_DN2819_c0_g1~~TRINITY_DN2819_c0_g1_i1.p2  ORF type:complete len:211 (+),score=47.78 TRINITY_DN2819_c0_g1_i1:1050-1682(+)